MEEESTFVPLDDAEVGDVEVRKARVVPAKAVAESESEAVAAASVAAASVADSAEPESSRPTESAPATPADERSIPPLGVASSPESESKPKSEPASSTEPKPEPESEPESEPASSTEPKPEPESESEPEPESESESSPRPSAEAKPIVSVEGIRGGVLKGVGLEVGAGVTALIGAQGAGKTLLLRILLGIDAARGGQATVLGLNAKTSGVAIRRRVGYVPEDLAFTPGMTGIQLSKLVHTLYPRWDMKRYYDLLARLGVPARRAIEDLLPAVRARLALGAALAHKPELLVVDVPGQLDALGRHDLLLGVREERGDTPTLIATNEPRDVESLAERVLILAAGTCCYSGSPSDLVSGTRRLRLRAGAESPDLPAEVTRVRLRPRADGATLWVHAVGPTAKGLADLEGVRSVDTVDLEEAILARIRGAEQP